MARSTMLQLSHPFVLAFWAVDPESTNFAPNFLMASVALPHIATQAVYRNL